MEKSEETTTEGDGKKEEQGEEPRESVGTMSGPAPGEKKGSTADQTNDRDPAGDHPNQTQLTRIEMLSLARDIFRGDEM
jgi:hypothetical protein